MSSSELAVQTSSRLGFLPTTYEQALDFASQMSKAKLLPKHLQNSPADCFRVVLQATRWQMDPYAVADKTSVINDKLMYEGQLVAAVVNARGHLSKRLSYTFTGTGEARTLIVAGTIKGEDAPCTIDLTLVQARKINKNGQVNINPDQQMCYIGARIWARRHTPELMLGVYADDEMPDEPEAEPMNVTPAVERPPAPARRGSVKAAAEAEKPATGEKQPTEKADKFAGPTVDAEMVEPDARKEAEHDAKVKAEAAAFAAKQAEDAKKATAEDAKPKPLDTSKVPEVAPGVSYSGLKGKAWPQLCTATIKSIATNNGATPHHKLMVTSHSPAEAEFEVVVFGNIEVKDGVAGPSLACLVVGKTIEFNAEAKLRPSKEIDPATKKPLPNLTKAPAIIASNISEAEVEAGF